VIAPRLILRNMSINKRVVVELLFNITVQAIILEMADLVIKGRTLIINPIDNTRTGSVSGAAAHYPF